MRERTPTARAARFIILFVICIVCQCGLPGAAWAQTGGAAALPSIESIDSRVADARDLGAGGDASSVDRLHEICDDSLLLLADANRRAALVLPSRDDPSEKPGPGADLATFAARRAARERLRQARESVATAHFAWGMAADHFARRDESITALARALDFANKAYFTVHVTAPGPNETTTLQRDSRSALALVLRDGLPLYTQDDAMDIIASEADGGLWTPKRTRFTLPPAIGAPVGSFVLAAQQSGGNAETIDLLYTSGKLFSPDNHTPGPAESRLTRVPPLFRTVPSESLPSSLRMDRITDGYARETSGPHAGQWRRLVRVYYASPYETRDNRDDSARAEALCLQLLRVASTVHAALGLANPYTYDGMTTVWLSEVSAWWPNDDAEPGIASQLPPRMPEPNTPQHGNAPLKREVESSPLDRPWRASATIDSAPGDILFFKMTQPRTDVEWLREMIHEYGHVSVPPFDRFAPPIEPYGNGYVGETLGMLWAASAPDSYLSLSDEAVGPDIKAAWLQEIDNHVARNAVVSLQLWQKEGPDSVLKSDRTQAGLAYLAGLSVYLDRTYGSKVLGSALRPLVRSSLPEGGSGVAAISAATLLKTVPNAVQNAFNSQHTALPLWLGSVFAAASRAESLSNRSVDFLKDGVQTGWVYVPRGAERIEVMWSPNAPSATLAGAEWKNVPRKAAVVPGHIEMRHLVLEVKGEEGWREISLTAHGPVSVISSWISGSAG